jgi:putative ABC transport system permease protein
MNLALRDIQHQPKRFVATAVGLGLLLTIVLAMGGIYRGMVEEAVLLVDRTGADLWIVQEGTKGPFAERSSVPLSIEDRARATPGVAWARPFSTYTTQLERSGKSVRVTLVGLGWPEDRGGGLGLVRGRALEAHRGELVVDEGLGLRLGEVLDLGGERLRVVGTTKGMVSSGGDPLAFVTHADLLRVSAYASPEAVRSRGPGAPPLASGAHAVLVGLEPGAGGDDVLARIDRWGDVTVFTAEGQRDLLLRGVIDKARKQIGLFRALLAIVSGIVVSLVVFNMTAAKTREIALLKLMGAKSSLVAGMIVQQSLALSLLAYGVAFGLARTVFEFFPRRVAVGPEELAGVLALSIAIALAASFAAVRRALSIPPTTILAG